MTTARFEPGTLSAKHQHLDLIIDAAREKGQTSSTGVGVIRPVWRWYPHMLFLLRFSDVLLICWLPSAQYKYFSVEARPHHFFGAELVASIETERERWRNYRIEKETSTWSIEGIDY